MKRLITLSLTPQELAEEFAEMNSAMQVDVLVAIALRFQSWGAYRQDMANIHVADQLKEAGGPAVAMVDAWVSRSAKLPTEAQIKAWLEGVSRTGTGRMSTAALAILDSIDWSAQPSGVGSTQGGSP